MYRLSASLLDSFDYFLSIEDEEQSRQKRDELIAYLRGEKTTSEAMQKGLDFEQAVMLCAMGHEPDVKDERYKSCVIEIARQVRGSVYQYHVERRFDNVILHGYMDFLNRNRVDDLKTTSSYEVGKYRNRSQHRIYLYCLQPEKIVDFRYIITDFRNIYYEDYQWNPSFEDDLRTSINRFFDYLDNDTEMKQAYESKDHTEIFEKTMLLGSTANEV